MKGLEEYIRKNRDQLDVDQPENDRIWAEIRVQSEKRSRPGLSLLRIAATLLILFGSVYLFYTQVLMRVESSGKENAISLGDISESLAEKENFYLMAITRRWEEIQQFEYNRDELKVLFDELEYLDHLDNEYLQDLEEMGANEKVIRSMLNNYEKRIRVLEKILAEIEKKENHENTRIQISV